MIDAIKADILRIVIAGEGVNLDKVQRAPGQLTQRLTRLQIKAIVSDNPLRQRKGLNTLLRIPGNQPLEAAQRLHGITAATQIIGFQHQRRGCRNASQTMTCAVAKRRHRHPDCRFFAIHA
ncbi:hypothetical protein [Pseudomonas syringae]|uniref:hypothetical protein n=1 Tax=Pseudomonas syringae TaxID=317 RepID=UPI0018E1C375|nr:hypothetical protein [Pseudomonas syringae]